MVALSRLGNGSTRIFKPGGSGLPANYIRFRNYFQGASVSASTEITGAGSYVTSNGLWSPTLQQNNGSIQGDKTYYINSRDTASNRLMWYFPTAYLNNYQHISIQFEYKIISADGFATTFNINDGNSVSTYSYQRVHWRSDRGVSGGQSSWLHGNESPTASSTWDDSGGFNWYNTWLPVEVYHNRTAPSAYIKIAGYKVFEVSGGATLGNYINRSVLDGGVPSGVIPFSWAQYQDSAASDNGIEMYMDAIDIVCWNGSYSDKPAYVRSNF